MALFGARNAALEGPLFHVAAGGIVRQRVLGKALERRRVSAWGQTWKNGASAPR